MSMRVVVTGLGVVSPIGIGVTEYWDNLIKGKSGIGKITSFDASKYPSQMAAEIKDFDPTKFICKKRSVVMDRSTQFIVSAAKLAVLDSMLDISESNRNEIQVVTGTALGGLIWVLQQQMNLASVGLENVDKHTAGTGLSNSHSGDISIELNVRGASETFSVACSSAYSALAYAIMKIHASEAKVVIVGAGDAPIWPLQYASLCVLGAHSRKNEEPSSACRPFSVDRDGMVLGEGAAALVVEEYNHAVARNANIYAEIGGCGITCEATGMFHQKGDSDVASRAIQMALENSRLNADDITFINSHGLGTVTGDMFEATAIKGIFHDKKTDVTSIKASVGHALAGAGAMQFVTSALSIKKGIIPPVANFSTIDPLFGHLNIITEPKKIGVKAILNNSFAFHGKNAAAVLKKVS